MTDDFFAELDAEIKLVTDKATIRQRAADAKKKSNNRWIPREQREAAEADYFQLRAIIEADLWKAIATVALFSEQQCDGCGSVHRLFLQYMEAQVQHKKLSNKRWIRTSVPNSELPRETFFQPHRTHICAHCADDHGFKVEEGIALPISHAPLSVSDNYLQGDINGPSEAN